MKQEHMNPIEERFWKYLRRNPWWSTYKCFASAVCGRDIPERVILMYFELVDKEDYLSDPEEKNEGIDIVIRLSKNGHYNKETKKFELGEAHLPVELRFSG